MKASPIITVHYRNSICTITAVQTTLTYVVETTYSRGYRNMRGYEQRLPYPAPNHFDRVRVPNLSVSGDNFDLVEDDPHDPTTTSEPEAPMQSPNQLPVVTDLVDARSA
jgi:hypothetical protein